MMGLAGLVGRWVGRAWPPTIRPSSKAPPPGCSHLLGGPMEGNKLLLLGQGHSADGGERPGAGGGGAGVRVVVRLCLGGRSRSRDLAASAGLRMAPGNSTINWDHATIIMTLWIRRPCPAATHMAPWPADGSAGRRAGLVGWGEVRGSHLLGRTPYGPGHLLARLEG